MVTETWTRLYAPRHPQHPLMYWWRNNVTGQLVGRVSSDPIPGGIVEEAPTAGTTPSGVPAYSPPDVSTETFDHNHDGRYSLYAHNHSGVYSPVAHLHTGVYSAVAHAHAGTYVPFSPTIENVAAAGPNVLTAAESHSLFTNTGAGAQVGHTLPTAAAGLVFEFHNLHANGVKVTAGASDVIRMGNTVSKAAGYISATRLGASVMLVAIDADTWLARSIVDVWTVETS